MCFTAKREIAATFNASGSATEREAEKVLGRDRRGKPCLDKEELGLLFNLCMLPRWKKVYNKKYLIDKEQTFLKY